MITTTARLLVTSITRALFSLERSHGRQRARKNARKRALGALRDIRVFIDGKYPTLNPDGSERKKPEKKFPCCPVCRIPCDSWTGLVKHLRRNHQIGYDTGVGTYCVCGKKFSEEKGCGMHLQRQPDLKAHITIGRLGQNGATK